jgi:Family of unknown function (DUF6427)
MFRLLARPTNIFSIPFFIGALCFIFISYNAFYFDVSQAVVSVVLFLAISLGYYIFNQINLTHQSHLPLLMYSLMLIGFYNESLNFNLAMSLLLINIIILILTNEKEVYRKKSYFIVGFLMSTCIMFQAETWPVCLFLMVHIITSSERMAYNLLQIFCSLVLSLISVAAYRYLFGLPLYEDNLLPYISYDFIYDYQWMLLLSPIVILLVFALSKHLLQREQMSPNSTFRYNLLIIFLLSVMLMAVFYMGENYNFLIFLALPSCIFIARFLLQMRESEWQEILLWLMIISLIGFKAITYYQVFNLI